LIAGDEDKAGLLRRLVPGAAESGRLLLLQADLYDAATFAPAMAGCRFVFLVATLFQHDATSAKVSGSHRVRSNRCSSAGLDADMERDSL
jgi:hypothetical protein